MKILLVEDDEVIGKGVMNTLLTAHYSVEWVKDGQSAESTLLSQDFNAVILDIGLPKRNGLEVLQNIRNQGVKVPVLLLTARGSAEDMVRGLEMGADDYVSKPFTLDVLCARLRALLRRTASYSMMAAQQSGLKLDPTSYSVYIEGERIAISRREYALLNKLMENVGEVVPREALSQCIYGLDAEMESNAVEVHVHNLRKKLRGGVIKTIRGVGYIVDSPRY